ncbi:MAG: hypothetical protein IKV58_01370 [Oscillospiraceae bacterium]|nr:hypothetical protein [Oscillospiraceae bacterium]
MERKSISKLGRNIFLYSVITYILTVLMYICINSLAMVPVLDWIAQFLGIFLFCSISYVNVWEEGHRDCNRVAVGTFQKDMLKGFKAGLVATIPLFALYLVLLLSRLGIIPTQYLGMDTFEIYKIFSMPTVTLLNAIYKPSVVMELSAVKMILIFLTTLTLPISSLLAYVLGYNDFSVIETIKFNKKEQ